MPFNGSGVFQRVRNWVADATAGVKIRADFHDSEDDNLANGLTNCITKDGQTTITQNIPFNNKRATGLADPVNPQDAATKAYSDAKTGATLPLAGGTMTGDLTLSKGTPSLILNSTDTGGDQISGLKSGKQRWLLRPGNDAAESGSNAGSDFDLHRYADDGSYLGQALGINRASGAWSIAGGVNFNGNPNIIANGVIYLTDTSHFVQWNGTRYYMPNGPLQVGDPVAGADAATVNWVNANVQPKLNFTPVEQGGGTGMATNKIRFGWDGSGLRVQVDNNDTFSYVMLSNNTPMRLVLAGDQNVAVGPQSTIQEPYPNAVMTGYAWVIVTYPLVSSFRWRYLQARTPGGWVTVAYG